MGENQKNVLKKVAESRPGGNFCYFLTTQKGITHHHLTTAQIAEDAAQQFKMQQQSGYNNTQQR